MYLLYFLIGIKMGYLGICKLKKLELFTWKWIEGYLVFKRNLSFRVRQTWIWILSHNIIMLFARLFNFWTSIPSWKNGDNSNIRIKWNNIYKVPIMDQTQIRLLINVFCPSALCVEGIQIFEFLSACGSYYRYFCLSV